MSMGELQDEAELKSKMKNMRPRGKNVEFAFSTISFRFGSNLWVNAHARCLASRVIYLLADVVAHLIAIHCVAILVLYFLPQKLDHAFQELFDSLPSSITRTRDNRCTCCCNDWMGNQVWQDRAPEECKQRHE
jgi:hypothetical protein